MSGKSKLDQETLTFENAHARLEEIVNEFEDGELSLEKTMALYEEGAILAQFCQKKLESFQKRLSGLISMQNGSEENQIISPSLD